MKIALFIGRALPKIGGSELVVDGLARSFTKEGHRTWVIAPRPKWWSFPDDSDKCYHVVRYPPHLSKTWGVDWYLRYLLKAHRRHSFDIIHCHELYPQAYLATQLKQLFDIPIVFTSHGCDVFVSHDRYKRKKVMDRVQYAASHVDAMIAVSNDTKANYAALCTNAAPIYEIPNGIDLAELKSPCARPDSLPSSIKVNDYFLFLGRLTHRKAADILIRAYAKLHVSMRLPLVIAGYGRENAKLRRLSQSLGVKDNVIFLGSAFSELKTYLLQNARCTVVPTRSWEACSLVTLESFAAGTPVIGTRVEGVEHLIDVGKNGLLIEPEDDYGLSRAMESLARHPEESARMGRHARQTATAFCLSSVSRQHLALYEALMTRSPAPLPHNSQYCKQLMSLT